MQPDPASPTGGARPVFKVFKCRARLTPASHPVSARCSGCAAGSALEERVGAWMEAGVSISCSDQYKSLTAIRNDPQFSEFAALSVQVFLGVLQRLDRSFRGFFRRARRRQARLSALQGGAPVAEVSRARGMVRRHVKGLPPMQLRTSRALPEGAALKTLRTEVHLGFAFPPVAPKEAIARPVGIDAGIAKRLTLSNGGEVAKREVHRSRRSHLQRALARSRVGSGGMFPLPVAAAGAGNRSFYGASGAVAPSSQNSVNSTIVHNPHFFRIERDRPWRILYSRSEKFLSIVAPSLPKMRLPGQTQAPRPFPAHQGLVVNPVSSSLWSGRLAASGGYQCAMNWRTSRFRVSASMTPRSSARPFNRPIAE